MPDKFTVDGCENWLRLVGLINYAGKSICYDILHTKKGIKDGEELYSKLIEYETNMHYQIHNEVFCPSDKTIDESKFDLLMYTTVIQIMFSTEYNDFIYDVTNMRNDIFHMKNISISMLDFQQRWIHANNMLKKYGFDVKSIGPLKTCDLRKCEGIFYFSHFYKYKSNF